MVATSRLKESDRLEGASIFIPLRCRVHMLLEELDLWEIVEGKAIILIDASLLVQYNKNVAKAKRIILDSVNYHLILHIVGKTTYHQYEVLTSLE